jgi:hypothetical protein
MFIVVGTDIGGAIDIGNVTDTIFASGTDKKPGGNPIHFQELVESGGILALMSLTPGMEYLANLS